ncbi:leucyl aminopeptidase [Asticcacaulis benevestitus]|uniref:Probable cytosol aminopeptidase n=1 Tax=Asticcacaulis benevestitus DSM 16100 = ATCC BAA-896 TaxID=1121022 RepID=V4RT66_9CAUL|nr:leucyl aminopeptidase [Asticcacaulis benevestitus]ESQ94363.1 aminopeptidase A [Asticcacaulis benevestitus DSM 16100 = ATCC BAA-896]
MSQPIITFATKPTDKSCLAVILGEGETQSKGFSALDSAVAEEIKSLLSAVGFKATRGKAQLLNRSGGAVVAVGGGDLTTLDTVAMETIAASLYHVTKASGFEALSLDLTGYSAELAAHAVLALHLAAYRFDKYFGQAKLDKAPTLKNINVVCDDVAAAETAYVPLGALREGIVFARDLVSEPANILYPQSYADRVKAYESIGLKVEILGEPEMEKLGMHSLLGVGLGSRKESKLVVMQWLGALDQKAQPVAFVGKGVTFDTGGISIKPAEGMEDMKWDMGGSAAVVGTMVALAGRKAKVNAIGIIGLVENMPDGNAQRPGDVVKAMSGTTIEVINTDAEGRLVLADALWYCQDRFKPQFMIDLATLTGAMIIALGMDYAGVFSNNDELAEKIGEASKSVLENTWRMPLPAQYEKQIDSKIADIRNIGGRPAGSITAALFLQRFVNGTPWAHMDIAPVAWTNEQRIPTVPEGATGFGVRTLNALVAKFYEG